MVNILLLVEVTLPGYAHKRLYSKVRRLYKDTLQNFVRDGRKNTTYVFLKDSPKGWWVALSILREGAGKLYMVKEVKYMDIPSMIMELSFKEEWSSQYEQVIEEQLEKWGLKNE